MNEFNTDGAWDLIISTYITIDILN